MSEILKAISELLKNFFELFDSLPENQKRFVIIPVLIGFMLGLSRALYSIIYPTTFRLNFRAQKRRDRIEYIIKLLERQTILDDTNIAVLKEELNKLVFEDVSGIVAKPLKRNSLRDLYDAAYSNFGWRSISAAYSLLDERDGKLAKGISKAELIFGIFSGIAGVGFVLGGLFLLYLRPQLPYQLALFSTIVGRIAILVGFVKIIIFATPILIAWQLQKWIPAESKTENDGSLNTEFDQSDIIVVLEHPHGRVEVSLEEWISTGPGEKPFVRPVEAKRKGSSEPLPLSVIPLRCRNSKLSRTLIALRVLKDPWK